MRESGGAPVHLRRRSGEDSARPWTGVGDGGLRVVAGPEAEPVRCLAGLWCGGEVRSRRRGALLRAETRRRLRLGFEGGAVRWTRVPGGAVRRFRRRGPRGTLACGSLKARRDSRRDIRAGAARWRRKGAGKGMTGGASRSDTAVKTRLTRGPVCQSKGDRAGEWECGGCERWTSGARVAAVSGEAGRWAGRGASLGRASAVSGEALGLAGMAARERAEV